MKLFQSMMKALLALMLTFGAAQANDSTFGGTGATLLPIKNTNISMMDEHIVIDGVPTSQGPMGHWKTTCTFHFKNETKEKQTITMGFPFMRTMDIVTDLPELTPAQVKALPPTERAPYLAPFIKSFTTKVRGAAVKSKEIDIKDKRSPYGHAWVWDVTFEPGETVEVVNTYEHDNSGDVEGHDWIDYILLTGKNWKDGKIGRSLLEVKPNTEFVHNFSHSISTLPKGAKLESDGKYRKLVWDLKDFKPEDDLYFSFYPLKAWRDIASTSTYSLMLPDFIVEDPTCKDLRIARNRYYAWYGYPFKSADLKDYFKKQWWYQEDPNFDVKKLSTEAQEILGSSVRAINALEKEKGCAK
jgi:hypothetical protein